MRSTDPGPPAKSDDANEPAVGDDSGSAAPVKPGSTPQQDAGAPAYRSSAATALADDPTFLRDCGQLWLHAFTGPPWFAEAAGLPAQRTAFRRRLGTPGTTVERAVGPDGELLGVAWGWPGDRSPDDDLSRAVRAAVGTAWADRLWRPDVVVLAELMVDPRRQGLGIGTHLVHRLMGDRPSWLLSHPQGAGIALYHRLGWGTIGDIDRGGHPLVVMARPESTPATVAIR